MNKTTFASYKFRPSDVIEGLNRYFAESKANRYLRVPLEIRNGEVKPGNYYVIRNIVFVSMSSTPKIKECGYYYIICDVEEVVGVAINWLREEHDIFYTPGMEAPVNDFDVDEAAKEYEKATLTMENLRIELVETRRMYHNSIKERNQFGRRLMEIRKASGMADNDPGDLVEYVESLRKSEETYEDLYKQYRKMYCELRDAKFTKVSEERDRYKWLYENLKNGMESVLQEAEERED